MRFSGLVPGVQMASGPSDGVDTVRAEPFQVAWLPKLPVMPADISSMKVTELLRLWAGTMTELRGRGVLRTNNNPVGDIAEAIAHEHYGGRRRYRRASTPGKVIRKTGLSGRTNLSPIRDSDYDVVVVVAFDTYFSLTATLEVPREVVEELFPIRPYVNGRVITVTDALTHHPDVTVIDMSAA